MGAFKIPESLKGMLHDAGKYSGIAWVSVILISLINPSSEKLISSVLAIVLVVVFFLTSILVFRYQGRSAISFLALVQLMYLFKLLLTAIFLIVVFRFFDGILDRQWFGLATIIVASGWLGGEIRGFFRIRYILDIPPPSHDDGYSREG